MVQPKFVVADLIDTHGPTDEWSYSYQEECASFFATIVCVGSGEYAVLIHIYAENDAWNVSGGTGGGGVDECQRLWFDDFGVADAHVRATFARVIGG